MSGSIETFSLSRASASWFAIVRWPRVPLPVDRGVHVDVIAAVDRDPRPGRILELEPPGARHLDRRGPGDVAPLRDAALPREARSPRVGRADRPGRDRAPAQDRAARRRRP